MYKNCETMCLIEVHVFETMWNSDLKTKLGKNEWVEDSEWKYFVTSIKTCMKEEWIVICVSTIGTV